jgi:branched-chain amino acid transport system permease protein
VTQAAGAAADAALLRPPAGRIDRMRPYAVVLLCGGLAFCLPWMSPTGQVLSLATSALVMAIGGSGLGFLWGQSGQLTLAHGAVFGLGAYAAATASKHLGIGFTGALPLSIGVGLLAGLVVALPSLRTRGHYFVILTFAIGEVISVVEMRLEALTGGINGITVLPGAQEFLGLALGRRASYYQVVVLFATAVFLLVCALMRSRWGIVLRAGRENPDLATSLGVSLPVHRLLAFAVSGAIAGLAGHLHLYHVKFIAPELFGSHLSVVFLLVVLLGGKAYLLGPALGAVVYVFLPESIGLSPVRSQIAFGVLLIVMILLAPSGLLGLPERIRSRRRARASAPPESA